MSEFKAAPGCEMLRTCGDAGFCVGHCTAPARATDADLIYNALLRVERRLEKIFAEEADGEVRPFWRLGLGVVNMIRQEIGNGLAEERR